MIWLWISLGVIGGFFLILIIISYIVFHLTIVRDSAWNTDGDQVIFKFEDKYKKEAEQYYKWFHSEGEVVVVRSDDGLNLCGRYFKHPHAKRTIIMVHGYRGKPDYDFCLSHHWLFENESNILCVYSRATGLSEGKYITMGIKERDDLHQWFDYVCQKDNLPIYFSGISMGAATVMMSMYKPYSDRLKGLFLDCGYSSIYRQFQSYIGGMVGKPLATLFLFFANWWTHIFAHFGMKQADTRKIMKDVTLPLLFAHSDKDKFVLPYHTLENYEACGSEHKYLLIGQGAEHGDTFLTNEKEYKEIIKKIFNICENN